MVQSHIPRWLWSYPSNSTISPFCHLLDQEVLSMWNRPSTSVIEIELGSSFVLGGLLIILFSLTYSLWLSTELQVPHHLLYSVLSKLPLWYKCHHPQISRGVTFMPGACGSTQKLTDSFSNIAHYYRDVHGKYGSMDYSRPKHNHGRSWCLCTAAYGGTTEIACDLFNIGTY